MRTFTQDLFETTKGYEEHWLYNGLDCCITLECFEELWPSLGAPQRMIYRFELDSCGPALEMTWRGLLVDILRKEEKVREVQGTQARLENYLNLLGEAVGYGPINARSPTQLLDLFYRHLGIPPVVTSIKGVKKSRMDRESLEKLEGYFYATPFVRLILAIRDCSKTVSFLQTSIDRDNRFRSSYSPAATDTGRWNSSKNPLRTGGNGQNIKPALRNIFVADKGKKFCNLDLEQAESRGVGAYVYLVCGEPEYLDACEAGDLHTRVAQLLWAHIRNRDDAEKIFYREFSYRDMSKRGGHGTNYYGQPATMARHLKLPTGVLVDFQERYFGAFPGIRKYHLYVATELGVSRTLTTLLGRERSFWGRPDDDTTLRAAIAYLPQSLIADYINRGLHRAWSDPKLRNVTWHQQGHDALLFQYDEADEDGVIPRVQAHIEQPIVITPHSTFHPAREMIIPTEPQVGWNWSKKSMKIDKLTGLPSNPDPDAMITWKGHDSRRRQRSATPSFLETIL